MPTPHGPVFRLGVCEIDIHRRGSCSKIWPAINHNAHNPSATDRPSVSQQIDTTILGVSMLTLLQLHCFLICTPPQSPNYSPNAHPFQPASLPCRIPPPNNSTTHGLASMKRGSLACQASPVSLDPLPTPARLTKPPSRR